MRYINEILFSHEKQGKNCKMKGVWQLFDRLWRIVLLDVGYKGPWFTWKRDRLAHNNIHKRLNREVANSNWKEAFPYFRLEHCAHAISNHCPLLMESQGSTNCQSYEYRQFKFEAA